MFVDVDLRPLWQGPVFVHFFMLLVVHFHEHFFYVTCKSMHCWFNEPGRSFLVLQRWLVKSQSGSERSRSRGDRCSHERVRSDTFKQSSPRIHSLTHSELYNGERYHVEILKYLQKNNTEIFVKGTHKLDVKCLKSIPFTVNQSWQYRQIMWVGLLHVETSWIGLAGAANKTFIFFFKDMVAKLLYKNTLTHEP